MNGRDYMSTIIGVFVIGAAMGYGAAYDRYTKEKRDFLSACAKANNVYKCEIVAVPEGEK